MNQVDRPNLSQIDHLADLAYARRVDAERSLDPADALSMVLSRWQGDHPRYGHETIHPFDTLLEAFKIDRSLTTSERAALVSAIVEDMAEAWNDLVEQRLAGRY